LDACENSYLAGAEAVIYAVGINISNQVGRFSGVAGYAKYVIARHKNPDLLKNPGQRKRIAHIHSGQAEITAVFNHSRMGPAVSVRIVNV